MQANWATRDQGAVMVAILPVTAIIAARNEERNISRCLCSLARAQATYVIDSGSQEATAAIAANLRSRRPNSFATGNGQRQRIATARTLILAPSIIVADEPWSMIDLSTRAEILAMMKAVQQEMELSLLYITHDISTAGISPTASPSCTWAGSST